MSAKKKFASVVCAGVVMVYSLDVSANTANVKQSVKTCAEVEVRSINVTADVKNLSEEAKIILGQGSPTISGIVRKAATVIAVGPVLGSMDSSKVRTELACTAKGVKLTATITRSANFHGAALKNSLWHPRIEATIVLRQPEILFEVTWAMRLSNGIVVHYAKTPPFLEEQTYPFSIKKTIR